MELSYIVETFVQFNVAGLVHSREILSRDFIIWYCCDTMLYSTFSLCNSRNKRQWQPLKHAFSPLIWYLCLFRNKILIAPSWVETRSHCISSALEFVTGKIQENQEGWKLSETSQVLLYMCVNSLGKGINVITKQNFY